MYGLYRAWLSDPLSLYQNEAIIKHTRLWQVLLICYSFFPLEEWRSCWVNQSPSATEQEAECGKWQWQEDFKHG